MGTKAKLAGAALALSAAIVGYFEGTRLEAYKDPIGIWTICEGHTGPEVKAGLKYTPTQCKVILQEDLDKAYSVVQQCYPVAAMKPYETASMVSMALNMGPGSKGGKDGVCTLKSGAQPTIRRLFNAGQPALACAEIPKWANPPLKGIVRRREAERRLCTGDVEGYLK